MKQILSTAALVLGLLFGAAAPAPVQANPAGDRVTLLWVLSPAVKTAIGNDAAIKTWIQNQTTNASTNSNTDNGGNTRYALATNSNGVPVYGTTPTGGDSIAGNAPGKASVDMAIAEMRDSSNADMVIVVTSNAADASNQASTIMDCAKSGAAAAPKAYVAASIYNLGGTTGVSVDQRIMSALALGQCAGPADAYAFMEGSGAANCYLYKTLMSTATSVGPRDIWQVNNNGLASTPGYSDVSSDIANEQMVSNAQGFQFGVFTYTATVTGSCTAPGSFQFCYHDRVQTDTRGQPTCTPGSNDPNASPPGCISTTNIQTAWNKYRFTCTGTGSPTSYTVNIGKLSNANPAKKYHGMAIGVVSTNDQVGKMNARFAEAAAYYQVKIAPMLKAAIQAIKAATE